MRAPEHVRCQVSVVVRTGGRHVPLGEDEATVSATPTGTGYFAAERAVANRARNVCRKADCSLCTTKGPFNSP